MFGFLLHTINFYKFLDFSVCYIFLYYIAMAHFSVVLWTVPFFLVLLCLPYASYCHRAPLIYD